MNQTQRYQASTAALLLILTAFYIYTVNNNTQLENTIQQLEANNTQQQHTINNYQNTLNNQQQTITNLTNTLHDLFTDIGLSETQISELNTTLAEKSRLIIQYVNTLVDELYDFQYDKAWYVHQINELKNEIEMLRAQLNSTG